MGVWDSFTDLVEAATPWSTVEAEAVRRGGAGSEKTPADKDDAGEGEAEDPSGPTPDKRDGDDGEQVGGKEASGVDESKDDEEGGDDAKDEPEEPEEEEEEETVDPKEKYEEECRESKACAPVKHHFDECVERVTNAHQEEKKGPHEDCVEEFFHLAHCANECAAPKVFAALK